MRSEKLEELEAEPGRRHQLERRTISSGLPRAYPSTSTTTVYLPAGTVKRTSPNSGAGPPSSSDHRVL